MGDGGCWVESGPWESSAALGQKRGSKSGQRRTGDMVKLIFALLNSFFQEF